jgi:hypothetical protein
LRLRIWRPGESPAASLRALAAIVNITSGLKTARGHFQPMEHRRKKQPQQDDPEALRQSAATTPTIAACAYCVLPATSGGAWIAVINPQFDEVGGFGRIHYRSRICYFNRPSSSVGTEEYTRLSEGKFGIPSLSRCPQYLFALFFPATTARKAFQDSGPFYQYQWW